MKIPLFIFMARGKWKNLIKGALTLGALMINIMFNMTLIARKYDGDKQVKSAKHKQKYLIESAEYIIRENEALIDQAADYEFSREWTFFHSRARAFSSMYFF